MVANALHDSGCSGVPHSKPLSSNTSHEGFPSRRTVQSGVASEDSFVALEGRLTGLVHDKTAATQALPNVIVRVALELEGETWGKEVTEGLTRRTLELHVDSAIRQPRCPESPGHLKAQDASNRAVDVLDGEVLHHHLRLVLEGGCSSKDKLPVEHVGQLVILRHTAEHAALRLRSHGLQRPSWPQQVGEVQVCCFPMLLQVRTGPQQVCSPDELCKASTAQRSHDLSDVLRHHEEVIDEVLWLASELLPEFRILRCNTHGARVQVALAHHDATQGDERRRGHRNLLCPKQSGHDDIAPGSDLAVSLHSHSVPQPVQHERLVGLSDADLPRQATMLDGSPLGSTSAPGHARDREVVGLALCDTRGDDADADPCDELHGDTCGWVCVFQVTDQLCHIFDGIHVMMRRRRDETHTRRGLPGLSDFPDDLVARELSTLARLCPLRQLNLDLIGIGEVFCRYPETP
mmetsp:Transcript_57240/g.149089  ORF Transcript_57240/g.149089 Transcript_57240/m.149089 type:complete len:462 (-) Transcript_57240:3115-4500(-)